MYLTEVESLIWERIATSFALSPIDRRLPEKIEALLTQCNLKNMSANLAQIYLIHSVQALLSFQLNTWLEFFRFHVHQIYFIDDTYS